MKKIILVSILFLGIISCEDSIDRTIFVPDKNDSNLPAYTEWGYNSFGAKYERNYFLSTNNLVPCKITYKDGRINFYLIGYVVGSRGYGYYSGDMMSLLISFPFSAINDYAGLLALNAQTIDISDAGCSVSMSINDAAATNLEILSGQLCFKRAQLLRIDDKPDRVILSGTFTISFLNQGRPESISDGRFDLGINNKDFYSF